MEPKVRKDFDKLRSKELDFIENMDIKVFIPYTWQAGNIKEVWRLMIRSGTVILVPLSVDHHTAAEFSQVVQTLVMLRLRDRAVCEEGNRQRHLPAV